MELNYFECPWPLKAAECPCDLHFIEYLKFNKVEGKTIFHFGTGEHHIVGKDNHQRGNPNEILGITVSKDEHQSYIDFIVGNPIAANSYKVIFADIYTLSSKMLPAFDLISLFHLAEYYDDRQYWGPEHISSARRLNSVYARLDDRQLLKLFVSKLNPHGKILFYKRSDAFVDKPYPAAILVNELISQGVLAVEDEYESLMICGHAGTKSP